jgi:hypothetical protein
MDFVLTEEQKLIRQTVRSYCDKQYRFPERLNMLRSGERFNRKYWKAYAEFGWLGAILPEDVGGSAGSLVDMAILLEELGRYMPLEPFVPCAVLAGQAVNAAGSPEQRQALLPPMIRGEQLLALAHTEKPGRGDTHFVETRAVPISRGRYAITGHKPLVLGGGSADTFIVAARTAGDSRSRDGLSLFLVPPNAPRLERRSFSLFDGEEAAELLLHEVEVEAGALLGIEHEAADAIEDAVDHAIVCTCAEAVGAMDHVVTSTRDFLKTRKAYGATLSTFQALQHRLADMLVELELSRSMLFRVIGALTSPERLARRKAVSAAKALIGRSGRWVGAQGVQLHGGMGMADDYVIGHLFKRLSAIDMLYGSSELHLQQYARFSGLGTESQTESKKERFTFMWEGKNNHHEQDHAASQATSR